MSGWESDAAFLLRCLEEKPHTNQELLNRSYRERGRGLMIHSRAASLREKGHVITTRCLGKDDRRTLLYEYRLVQQPHQLELGA